jgi:gluconokinase
MYNRAAVVMGVAGCGKTSVGEGLAVALAVPFTEGDKLHPPSNVEKMSRGTPLTDEDRWPWLEQIGAALMGGGGHIAACSALKRSYRERIAARAGRPLSFIFLDGSRETLEKRMCERKGHFMPASLLDSQLATLERPGGDERVLRLDIDQPVGLLVVQARDWLLSQEI